MKRAKRQLNTTTRAVDNTAPQDSTARAAVQGRGIAPMDTPPPDTRDRSKWVLLLLPVLLAALNSNWMYSPAGYIDAWVYTGYFHHLIAFKSALFPDLYYGSRLPWLLPGYLAYRFLSLYIANYVLHFTFYYAATFSFYYLLKRGFGRWNALIGTILFGTYPAFLAAIGWDYVDGAGITYNLLSLAFIARAAESRRRPLWLALAGAAGFAMVYTNLFLAAYLPFPVAFFLVLTNRRISRQLFKSMVELLVWFGGGAALLTVLLGAINYFLDGHFWFYAPSIKTFFSLSSKPNQWRIEGLSWVSKAYWLGIPAAVATVSVVSAIRSYWSEPAPDRVYKRFFTFQYLAAAGVMVAWHFTGGVGLQLSYYTSYLIPSMFLAIGGMIAFPEDEWQPQVYWGLAAGTLGMFAFSIWLPSGPATALIRNAGFGTMAAVTAFGLMIRVFFFRSWQTLIAALLGLFLYQFVPPLQSSSLPTRYAWERIMKGAEAAWPYFQKGPAFFWYDAKEQYNGEFTSIASNYLWGFSYIGYKFPEVSVPDHLRPDTTAILVSKSDRAVQRADLVLRNYHLLSDSPKNTTVSAGGVSYNLTFFELEGVTGESIALEQHGKSYDLVSAKPGEAAEFPSSGWVSEVYPDGRPRMERRPGGIFVTTAERPYAYGSWYGPLVAKRSGTYRFVLKFKLLSGAIRWGGMTADSSRDLGHGGLASGTSDTQIASYTVKLDAGEEIVLVIANDSHGEGGPAAYQIQSVRASAMF